MRTKLAPRRFEFVKEAPENRILVESGDDGVLVRASRNNFSSRRKCSFIREIAAEGFVPDYLQTLTESEMDGREGVRWIVDDSWVPTQSNAANARAQQVLKTVSVGVILWVALMLMLVAGWF
jgi:hypothetical protein